MTGSAKLTYNVPGWSTPNRIRPAESIQISVRSGA
jgi:hypothetical protein